MRTTSRHMQDDAAVPLSRVCTSRNSFGSRFKSILISHVSQRHSPPHGVTTCTSILAQRARRKHITHIQDPRNDRVSRRKVGVAPCACTTTIHPARRQHPEWQDLRVHARMPCGECTATIPVDPSTRTQLCVSQRHTSGSFKFYVCRCGGRCGVASLSPRSPRLPNGYVEHEGDRFRKSRRSGRSPYQTGRGRQRQRASDTTNRILVKLTI